MYKVSIIRLIINNGGDILKKNLFYILLICSFYTGFAQSNYNSLNTLVDAHSISMGESFVALSNSSSGSFYNPATLNNIEGITTSFNKIYLDWMDWANGMYFFSLNGAVHTPYGTIGLFYNRFDIPSSEVRDENNSPVGKTHYYDHTYGIGYAKEIIPNLSTGISLKTYNFILERTPSIPNLSQNKTTSQPFLLDVGILYELQIFPASDNFINELSLGLSFQNFGTDYRINEKYQRLPHYARLGFSYVFIVNKKNEESLTPFRYTLTGQYCNHLNAWKTMRDAIDYWGTGMEVTFYEIVSLRMGGYAQPHSSIYGEKGLPSFRYGFGLNAPLRAIGIDTPIVIVFDFAMIPLSETDHWSYYHPKKNLTAFSFELRYEEDLF